MTRIIFGLGLSRTATTYLHELFQRNGFSSFHYPRQLVLGLYGQDKMGWLEERQKLPSWKLKGFEKERKAIDRIGVGGFLTQFDFVGDLPIPFYVQDLLREYPASKFILTRRDKESWLASMEWMLSEGRFIWKYDALDNFILRRFYGADRYDETALSLFYDEYHERIDKIFANSEGRLLRLDLPIDENDLEDLSRFLEHTGKLSNVPVTNSRRRSTRFDRFDFWMRNIRGYSRIKTFFSSI